MVKSEYGDKVLRLSDENNELKHALKKRKVKQQVEKEYSVASLM